MTEERIKSGKFKRGDRIRHNTGKHAGRVVAGLCLSSQEEWVYDVSWDDYDKAEARHTQAFVEANYQLED